MFVIDWFLSPDFWVSLGLFVWIVSSSRIVPFCCYCSLFFSVFIRIVICKNINIFYIYICFQPEIFCKFFTKTVGSIYLTWWKPVILIVWSFLVCVGNGRRDLFVASASCFLLKFANDDNFYNLIYGSRILCKSTQWNVSLNFLCIGCFWFLFIYFLFVSKCIFLSVVWQTIMSAPNKDNSSQDQVIFMFYPVMYIIRVCVDFLESTSYPFLNVSWIIYLFLNLNSDTLIINCKVFKNKVHRLLTDDPILVIHFIAILI